MYQALIEKYSAIAGGMVKKGDTIFDICGFPHYESVASNVLSFFFDNKREHELGSLFIDSLIHCAFPDKIKFEDDYQVDREVVTDKGNFIDLLLYNTETAIFIENKIYATLYNDLDDYLNTAKMGRKKAFGVVLSLRPESTVANDVVCITYDILFKEIKRRYSEHISNSKLNYLSLMFDFIRNIEELKEGNQMDKEFVEFLKSNHEEVSNLGAAIKRFHDDLRNTVSRLNGLIEERAGKYIAKQWPWRSLPAFFDIAVSDIVREDKLAIAVHATIDVHGWSFCIFFRNDGSGKNYILYDYCKERGINGKISNEGRYELEMHLGFEEPLENVAEKVAEIVEKVVK